MPREINGKRYLTQDEAARKLGISTRTLANWISRGVVTAPGTVSHGMRDYYAFTDKWIETAKAEVVAYKKNLARPRPKKRK